MGNGHNNDDDERKDLTRLEDLSEFLHEEDPDLESKFGDFNSSYHSADSTNTGVTGGVDLTDLNELEELPPSLPENLGENLGETPEESPLDFSKEPAEEIPLDFVEETSQEFPQEIHQEIHQEILDDLITMPDSPEEAMAFNEEPPFEETTVFQEMPTEEYVEDIQTTPPERFDEVKTFAQNFSYGQIQGGGNPPFSLVVRNLKYDDDKESIITLLSEFGLVNEQNLAETTKALELGNLLIPQIGEYSAIVLAHKLRRFDCDIEVGLSDEVHPSKSGEQNPKGLVKKDSVRQNKIESYTRNEKESTAKDIILTTTPTLEGHIIKKYIGVQTSFAIVDEEELERLKFVQSQNRARAPLHEYAPDEGDALSSEKAFNDYKSSFDYLFVSLAEELKSKAQKEKANALLGLSYQLQPLPFEKSSNGRNCYQLTASATMAIVTPE